MLALMDDSSSCTVKNAVVNALTLTDAEKKSLANGSKCLNTAVTPNTVVACATPTSRNAQHIDYDFIKCEGGSSGMSDLLPLMMMGGGMGGAAGGMGSMLPLLLLSDSSSSSSSDLLPLMMMSGGMGGGAAGGMDPMMMMLMLDDEKAGEAGCDAKHKIKKIFLTATGAEVTDPVQIRTAVKGNTILEPTVKSKWITDYRACLANPTTATSSSSSSLKDLLPLMMMGGMGGAGANGQAGAMDPM